MKSIFALIAAVAVLYSSSCSSTVPSSGAVSTIVVDSISFKDDSFKVVGYWASWNGSPNDISYDKLTHIIYAFALPTYDGKVTLNDYGNESLLRQLVTLAHAKKVRALLAIGGADLRSLYGDLPFELMAASPKSRDAFINHVLEWVKDYNLDGVDIDWEYPDPGISARYFDTLMTALGKELHTQKKLLSAAVLRYDSTRDGVLPSVFSAVDFLNIMAYDAPNTIHSSLEVANKALQYWLAKGLPKEKAILGVPFYGRPMTVSDGSYKSLVDFDKTAPYKDEVNGCFYNGIPTMKAKTKLAMEQGGGIMIWEVGYDTHDATSLLQAINDAMKKR